MIMDYDARFVLAHDMGDTKAADDVASVTGEAKRRAGDVPDIMLRDARRTSTKRSRRPTRLPGRESKKRPTR